MHFSGDTHMRDANIGDTFLDVRSDGLGSVTIVDIVSAGPCFLLRQADAPEWLPCFYVTRDRFLEITGGRARICKVRQKHLEEFSEETLGPIDKTTLIPAETLSGGNSCMEKLVEVDDLIREIAGRS